MKYRHMLLKISTAAVLLSVIFGCATDRGLKLFEQDTITQVSSYNGLLASLYDGIVSYDELRNFGDFGLGTFDKLDGEMVMLDGVLYQVDYSGNVNVRSMDNMTPYVTMVHFSADQKITVPFGLQYDQITGLIESKFKNPNTPYAVRIDGTFSYVKCRSVPAQEKPYPSLTEITKKQAVFEKKNIKGTVVGFWYPQYAGTLNVPGFHLHFISDDRTFGGHLLRFTAGDDVIAKIDRCTRILAYIPDSDDARKANLSLDRSADVKRVNRAK